MPTYKAPLREFQFLYRDVLKIEQHGNLPAFAEAPMDLIEQILEEGAKFCENVLAPLNIVGDHEGCKRHPDGSVTTPTGFKEAYRQLVEGGWPALGSDPAYGGQGLPHVVSLAWNEMVSSANMAFGMYPGLSHGAYEAIHHHGTDEQKQLYHEPDGAALRHRSRLAAHEGRAAGGRQLPDQRAEDFHFCWRA
jgi:alkylation response protein AidB-like acyl-CoA dehydrogenase